MVSHSLAADAGMPVFGYAGHCLHRSASPAVLLQHTHFSHHDEGRRQAISLRTTCVVGTSFPCLACTSLADFASTQAMGYMLPTLRLSMASAPPAQQHPESAAEAGAMTAALCDRVDRIKVCMCTDHQLYQAPGTGAATSHRASCIGGSCWIHDHQQC